MRLNAIVYSLLVVVVLGVAAVWFYGVSVVPAPPGPGPGVKAAGPDVPASPDPGPVVMSPDLDLAQLLRANNRGVGFMEQYNYVDAEKAFREVVAMSPRWTAGQINLAIALLNQNKTETLSEATALLRAILQVQPDNPYAHYSLAIILNQAGEAEAAQHFEAVTKIDPTDPHAWYYLAKSREADDPESANACLRRAAELSPNLSSAIYGLAMQHIRAKRRDEGQKLLKKHQELSATKWDEKAEIKYGVMGQYADVIGRDHSYPKPPTGPLPLFEPVGDLKVRLGDDTRWATAADFAGDATLDLRGRVRARFGVTTATLDFNADGKTDILLLGAVVRDGAVGDLLLRNEGDWQFNDVTREAGLDAPRASLGCAVGDVDNDGRPDLFIACAGPSRLFRNQRGKFDDVTDSVGIHGEPRVSLSAALVDLDQDGDLDIYVANYSAIDQVASALTGKSPPAVANSVYRNDSKARAVERDAADDSGGAPLELAFSPVAEPVELIAGHGTVAVATGDFDNDRDVDLCLVQDAARPTLVLNDRLMQFHRQELSGDPTAEAQYNGAVACDFDKDGRPDLWLANPTGHASLLLNAGKSAGGVAFKAGATNVDAMRNGRLIDLDLDGWFDVAGLAASNVQLGHNEAERLALVPDAFGLKEFAGDANKSAFAAAIVTDLDGDGPADVLAIRDGADPTAVRSLGNKHHWVKLRLTGMRDAGQEMRTNRDGVAARFTLHAGDLWVEAEQSSQIVGLGAAYEPVLVGLGPRGQLDVVRVRWPDGTLQAELGRPVDGLVVLGQEQRKPVSCPLLFTWNGTRYEYIADFLGGGGLGYLLEPGVYNRPDRDEAVKIESDKLAPNDGRYVVKITEPMDEVTYLDRLSLVVVDHPADWNIFPNERFAPPDSRPDWRLFAYREPIHVERATDHHDRDVTDTLRRWDRAVVDDFKLLGAWIGYAEEHAVTLDFGDRLARFGPADPLVLYLAGWVEYPFSETNYAASTAGVKLMMPTIERLTDDGQWQPIVPTAGIPAGSPKMMTLDMTGKLTGPRCVLRIRTNMQVYWDQIFAAPAEDASTLHVTELGVIDAELGYRGHLQEFSPDGANPTQHDYHRVDAAALVRQKGRYTRFGPCRELLNGDDDQFVIFGAGDELTADFDAAALPKLQDGWRRSFVLRTWGYCKSADVLTAHPDTVEPLPFRAMSGYPFQADESPNDRVGHADYVRLLNSRVVE
jgi:hypothetical protein